jgi:heterodisulfide reductase subunit C
MKWNLAERAGRSAFSKAVEAASGQNVSACSQCGKCSAGCPVLPELDVAPNRVMRLVQLGLEDEALCSETVWCCTACGTCAGRCPMGIDIVRVMDALRLMAERRRLELPKAAARVWTFYRAFLDSVRHYGRLNEVALMGGYNINSGKILTNMNKAPWFFLKGKVSLSPDRIRRVDRIERVFQRIAEIEGRA